MININRFFVPLVGLALGIVFGLIAMTTPHPAPIDSEGFSAIRAREDILRIAAEPHTVWEQEKLDSVRAFIVESLTGMGLDVETFTYPPITDSSGHNYPLVNISASISGKSGRYILLVSHYDSRPKVYDSETGGSLGAADDGYGVSTMLEVARILKPNEDTLQNGIRFLFTDAEETGAYGAKTEMSQNIAAWSNVNFVINIEARGVKGPVLLAETGSKNRATIELYKKARLPFGYSFATDVYRKMPNFTDFTHFLNKGYAGINIAVIDDLSYYHTPRDNPDNISLSSLQQYGEQVLPIVLAYTSDPRYANTEAFESKEDMVFFPWLPGVFVSYSATIAWIISGIVFLLFCVWFILKVKKKEASIKHSFFWLLSWLGLAILMLGAGLGISFLLGKANGVRWDVTYMPGIPFERFIIWGCVLLAAFIPWLISYRREAKGRKNASLLAGSIALNLIVLLLAHLFVAGASFMFALPILACLVGDFLKKKTNFYWIVAIPAALVIGIFLPIVHLLGLALTIGALGVLLFLTFLPTSMLGPLVSRP
jgi:hypothetical protein